MNILLPGRSYGNQDLCHLDAHEGDGFYYLGDRTVIKTVTYSLPFYSQFYYLGDRTVIKTPSTSLM